MISAVLLAMLAATPLPQYELPLPPAQPAVVAVQGRAGALVVRGVVRLAYEATSTHATATWALPDGTTGTAVSNDVVLLVPRTTVTLYWGNGERFGMTRVVCKETP